MFFSFLQNSVGLVVRAGQGHICSPVSHHHIMVSAFGHTAHILVLSMTVIRQSVVFSPTLVVYTLQCTVYSVQCTVYSVQCTVYSVQCTVYSVQCTVYSVQCTVYSVQCTKPYFDQRSSKSPSQTWRIHN